jgi:hypoxanthine phosphoribosyltransferase
MPDSVVGIQRSGLFPAVFLSQQLNLPMFVASEFESFPYPRLHAPLVVDTVAWSGGTMRRVLRRLERKGVADPRALVMYTRAEPFPDVPGILFLHRVRGIPEFWYDEPLGDD